MSQRQNILFPHSIDRKRALVVLIRINTSKGGRLVKITSAIRSVLIALVALAGLSSAVVADTGTVRLTIYKAGWVIGSSGGTGTLYFTSAAGPIRSRRELAASFHELGIVPKKVDPREIVWKVPAL